MTDAVIARRLAGFGSSIFAEMTELAIATDAINLGQGFPDTDGPPALLAAARAAIDAGHNQYPPVSGVRPLRVAVADHRLARYGTAYDPDTEVLITTGATAAITAAVLALCEAGDEVLVLDPCYDSYPAAVSMAGGVLRPVPLRPDGDHFTLDPADLRAAVGPRTRLVLLNSPHNPTGKVLTDDDLAAVAEVCERHDLIAVTDEVHEHLTFEADRPARTLAALPGMRDRTVVISGAGKTFSVTGWKVGWVCGPPRLVGAVRTAHQFLTFNSGTPFQHAVAEGLRDSMDWVEELRVGLRDQRDLLAAGLTELGFGVFRTEGTYFLQADVTPFGDADAATFCRALPGRTGVVAIPTSAFWQSADAPTGLVRFAFCKRPSVLESALDRLSAARVPR